MVNFLKKWIKFVFGNGGDEAHEVTEEAGYNPPRGGLKRINGQFVWVEENPNKEKNNEQQRVC